MKFFKEYIVSIFWMVVAGFVMTMFYYSPFTRSFTTYLMISAFTSSLWVSLWLGNSYLGTWISGKISWTKQPVRRFWVGMVAMIVYSLASVGLTIIFFTFVFDFDVTDDLATTLYSALSITIIISFFMHGRSFLQNWREAAVSAEKLQKEGVQAKYESLKNQVNPHFLFNSLNALTNLVYEDQDKAAKFIKQLSEVYRYVLDTRDKEMVSLTEELNFLKSYIFLQQIRFGNKLNIESELGSVVGNVAPLVLQMLIENAIKHNIISEEHPLSIRLYAEGNTIVVQNNLQKKQVLPEESAGVGLENIKLRYGFLCDKKVEVLDGPQRFIVKLPLL